jgi:hypothetical protein
MQYNFWRHSAAVKFIGCHVGNNNFAQFLLSELNLARQTQAESVSTWLGNAVTLDPWNTRLLLASHVASHQSWTQRRPFPVRMLGYQPGGEWMAMGSWLTDLVSPAGNNPFA